MSTLLLLLLAAPADAGTLTLEKNTGLVPLFARVDGVDQGQVKGGNKSTVLELPDGPHEVWLSIEGSGTMTLCHGVVDLAGAQTVAARLAGCTGLTPGPGPAGTASRGASVAFTLSADYPAWVVVDGGSPMVAPSIPLEINLAPGAHTLALVSDAAATQTLRQGTFTLVAGQSLAMSCTSAACTGFDAPVVAAAPPAPAPVAPSGAPAEPATPPPPASPAPAPASSSATCCVNRAFFECPDADAVYKCSGDFIQCTVGCAMGSGGSDCPMACLKDHPMDPSLCTRVASRDGECPP